jgi:ribosome biogenesis protein Nip4
MIKPIDDFLKRFHAEIELDESMMARKKDRYFLLNVTLKGLITEGFFYAGTYLGKTKGGRFFPSFGLLSLMARSRAKRIVVDRRTEWLFICGRDVFKKGIIKTTGVERKGDHALVLNEHGECLGFGRVLQNPDEDRGEVFVKNILDIGDFLRRER